MCRALYLRPDMIQMFFLSLVDSWPGNCKAKQVKININGFIFAVVIWNFILK